MLMELAAQFMTTAAISTAWQTNNYCLVDNKHCLVDNHYCLMDNNCFLVYKLYCTLSFQNGCMPHVCFLVHTGLIQQH